MATNDNIVNRHNWIIESTSIIYDNRAELVVNIPLNNLLDEARSDTLDEAILQIENLINGRFTSYEKQGIELAINALYALKNKYKVD